MNKTPGRKLKYFWVSTSFNWIWTEKLSKSWFNSTILMNLFRDLRRGVRPCCPQLSLERFGFQSCWLGSNSFLLLHVFPGYYFIMDEVFLLFVNVDINLLVVFLSGSAECCLTAVNRAIVQMCIHHEWFSKWIFDSDSLNYGQVGAKFVYSSENHNGKVAVRGMKYGVCMH